LVLCDVACPGAKKTAADDEERDGEAEAEDGPALAHSLLLDDFLLVCHFCGVRIEVVMEENLLVRDVMFGLEVFSEVLMRDTPQMNEILLCVKKEGKDVNIVGSLSFSACGMLISALCGTAGRSNSPTAIYSWTRQILRISLIEGLHKWREMRQ
jgi:hypothetical protein